MGILITGANGFIGKNLKQHLSEAGINFCSYAHSENISLLPNLLKDVDFIFHLAGVNRPDNISDFFLGNVVLTQELSNAVAKEVETTGRHITIVYSSSIQADEKNDYGVSKKTAENILLDLQQRLGVTIFIYRLPHIFGKWCKPNFNSVVATFCFNIANKIPIEVDDPKKVIKLVYIDDLIASFLNLLKETLKDNYKRKAIDNYRSVDKYFTLSIEELSNLIFSLSTGREAFAVDRVGQGLARALYATYISYLPNKSFSYALTQNSDLRGVFSEFFKTPDCGQVSYFTSHPGVSRGAHYHHSKTEKFLGVKGCARFKFKNILSNEVYEYNTSDIKPEVVESIPGWSHEITNVGNDEMIVILWANEVFDSKNPDTFPCEVKVKI